MLNPKYLHLTAGLGYRADAGESLVIARSLDHVEQHITETMYPELRALKYFPVIPGIDPGAKTYTFTVMNQVGRAEPVSERGKDLPNGDVYLSEHTSGIKAYGAKYSYTSQELREIAYASSRGVSIQLDTARANTVAQMLARKIDSTVAFGDPTDTRIKGVLNNASVTVESSPLAWEDMTAEELLVEMFELANRQVVISKETFESDTILLPTAHHQLVSTTPLGTAGIKTVMAFFMEAMREAGRSVSVQSWPLLALADAARTGPRAVAFKRSVEVAGAIVPAAFLAQPPQADDLEWKVPCECVCGGAAVKQPLGLYYRDGLGAIS